MRFFCAVLMLVVACARPTPVAPPAPPPPPNVPVGCLADLSGSWVHATDPSYRYEATDDGGTLTLVVSRFIVVDAGFRPRLFRVDAGSPDAGAPASSLALHADAGREARPSDAGSPDAGARDAGAPDAGARDAGAPDAGARDAGAPDSGAPDGGSSAGSPDAGAVLVLVVLERTTHGFVGETRATVDHPSGRRCEAHFHTELLACGDAGLQLTTDTAAALGEDCQAPARAQPVPRAEQRLIRPP
jgi:hypothetical protein